MYLEAVKIAYADKTNLATLGKLLIVFSAKVNLPYFLYLMVLVLSSASLIKQDCLLKSFQRTLILMTQIYLPGDVICDFAVYADNTILNVSKHLVCGSM